MRLSFNHQRLLLSVLSGLLWWAAWPTSPFSFLAFVAFVPLFFLDEQTSSNRRFFGWVYLALFIWNFLTTWWIYNASFVGAALAIMLNSLLMCVPWLLMRFIKRLFGQRAGLIAFVTFWISFEYIHHNWELSWPWLTLGNVFAMHPGWVQWYEATGTTGGSLWILMSNVLLFLVLRNYRQHGDLKKLVKPIAALVGLWLVPLLISVLINKSRTETLIHNESATRNVVVVQPNVDPYNEKFTAGTEEKQIQNLIALSEQQIDSTTTLVLWPETAIPVPVEETSISTNAYYEPVWEFLERHPQLSLLSGIDSYKMYGAEKKTATARYDQQNHFYYDEFNTAALMNSDRSGRFYHKAKLVPGVETLPSYLLWMNSLFESLGGASGTYGRDTHRVVFADQQHYFLAAPIICYESIYGDYVTEYVRKGANLLTIMTNDGWWGNTQGYRQHMNYARLRAIETRRWIARSANTGISCFIDPVGAVHQPQPWDTKAAIKMKVEPLESQTFFVRHGDYLSRILLVPAIVFLILGIIFKVRKQTFSNPHHVPTTKR